MTELYVCGPITPESLRMPTASKNLVIRFNNPDTLKGYIQRLDDLRKDMQSVNLNNHPLQWHTKLRWEDDLMRIVEFFQQMLPVEEPEL